MYTFSKLFHTINILEKIKIFHIFLSMFWKSLNTPSPLSSVLRISISETKRAHLNMRIHTRTYMRTHFKYGLENLTMYMPCILF